MFLGKFCCHITSLICQRQNMKKIQTIVRRLPLVHWPKKTLESLLCNAMCDTRTRGILVWNFMCSTFEQVSSANSNSQYMLPQYSVCVINITNLLNQKTRGIYHKQRVPSPQINFVSYITAQVAINPSNFHIFCHLENEKLLLMHCDKFFIHFKAIYWHLKIK